MQGRFQAHRLPPPRPSLCQPLSSPIFWSYLCPPPTTFLGLLSHRVKMGVRRFENELSGGKEQGGSSGGIRVPSTGELLGSSCWDPRGACPSTSRNEAQEPWRHLIKQGAERLAPQVRWAFLWGGGQARASVEAVGALGCQALALEAWLRSVMSQHFGGICLLCLENVV